MLALEKVLKQLPKSDLADAKTIDYNNDTGLKDVTSNKGSIIAAKKISKKYEKIRRKKKKKKKENVEPSNEVVKKPKLSGDPTSNKNARIATKKISDKYK